MSRESKIVRPDRWLRAYRVASRVLSPNEGGGVQRGSRDEVSQEAESVNGGEREVGAYGRATADVQHWLGVEG